MIYFENNPDYGDEDWVQRYRICPNRKKARTLASQAPEVGTEQAVVEGTLAQFGGTVEGRFYEDAVRLIDAEALAYSSLFEE